MLSLDVPPKKRNPEVKPKPPVKNTGVVKPQRVRKCVLLKQWTTVQNVDINIRQIYEFVAE